MADLSTDVRYVKGVGEQRAKALARLGIHTLRDLISYFPRAYEDRRTFKRVIDLQPGENACVRAMVAAEPTLSRIRKGLELVKLRAVDETGALDITFFNQTYRKNDLCRGETYIFFGRAEGSLLRKTMANPVVEREGGGTFTGRIVPIYPLTAGVSQTILMRSVAQGLAACRDQLEDPLPEEVRLSHGLCHVGYAYEQIHFPAGEEELAVARRRLVFEELFLLAIGLKKLRRRRDEISCAPWADTDLVDFYAALPFDLTGAQRRAIGEITADLRSGRPMNRLVQGDVGSGKTMVAAAALVCAARSGFQGALMAPTEILAEQHYQGLAPLLERLGITCGLLTGAMRAKERREVLARLADGELDVVIGTHALISADVSYARLGLVVTDEQHRFGVAQRSALSAKGERPHLLVMSATPIPRTLALIIYGDLDVSVIDELPPGRTPVETYVVREDKRARMYNFVRRLVGEGRQVYIICPAVEENTEGGMQNAEWEGDGPALDLKAVTTYAKKLQTEVFPDLRVDFLHGKMKPREKEAVMAAFAAGETQVLVSTTVIEVGVDVPNAALIIIENAERFGLSQLHQLRGRVGRGKHQSYCVLITSTRSVEAMQRLRTLASTTDGFKISEEDLKLRGPGDFFGSRQHGLPQMKLADLAGDMRLLSEAQESARRLLMADPTLSQPENRPVLERVRTLFADTPDIFN